MQDGIGRYFGMRTSRHRQYHYLIAQLALTCCDFKKACASRHCDPATHLRQHGAMVAFGILTGYAGRFAAHILKHRPTLTSALTKVTRAAGDENRLSVDMYRAMPRSSMRSLRWWPPMFPQRAFPVYRCGWKGLHTARAVARISASCLPVIGSIRQHQTEPESQRATARMVEPVDFDLANLECDAFDVSRNLRRGRPSLV